MSNQAKHEYLQAIRERYRRASKQEKHHILDEFCLTCGYNRKYAIRLLRQQFSVLPAMAGKTGRPKRYVHPALLKFLLTTWKTANLPCAKRLKAMLCFCVPHYQQLYGTLPPEVLAAITTISAATIDRLLAPIRSKYRKQGLATTKPGSLLKHHIPIATNQWEETRPGFIEADTVAHCGTSIAAMFVYTVNIVDIATGWTEQRAVWGKGEQGVLQALIHIEGTLPFPIRGFDADNGGEFMNWHLLRYFTDRKQPVNYTRSREYHKNDNAHIEGKNWTHIRQYLGYGRFDHPALVALLNDLYTTEWRTFHNFFLPSMKLVRKERIGAKIMKHYDHAQTPCRRLLASPYISKKTKNELQRLEQQCNPYLLQRAIAKKIAALLTHATPATVERDKPLKAGGEIS